ncbi:MAG: hypothetical protein HOP15_05710 [Planctomycetes bacterium]|nr:hypothetical protein [Planctomycetota bacterium]
MSRHLICSMFVVVVAMPASGQLASSKPVRPAAPSGLISPDLVAPSELRAMPCGTHVDLRWEDNSSREAGFAILRRAAAGGPFAEIALVAADQERFRDTTVSLGTTYVYRVAARAASGFGSRPSRPFVVTANAGAPVIVCSLVSGTRLRLGQEVRFGVSVSDPDGDLVSLRLLNPPPGLAFLPADFEGTPVTRELRWRLPTFALGRTRLVFQAGCAEGPRMTIDVCVEGKPSASLGGQESSYPVLGDVTGDGVMDVVVAASAADAGATDSGALYVWKGAQIPEGAPSAVLEVPSPPANLGLGSFTGGQAVQLADLNGDGVLDILAASPSTLFEWDGGAGLAGTVAPTATLVVPLPGSNDFLGNWHGTGGQLVQIADVTGDGRLDVVAAAVTADVGGVRDAGALFVWDGAALSGSIAPTAVLSIPGALENDQLGSMPIQGFHLADVSGDGILDVVVGATYADARDTGAVFVWAGGAGLAGAAAPLASLRVPGAIDPDRLGDGGNSDTMQLADVSGDGVLDVVVGGSYASHDGRTNLSAIYLWKGGATLTGALAPTAMLSEPSTHIGTRLSLFIADIDLDGILDVVGAGGQHELEDQVLHFWPGRDFAGAVLPSATLYAPDGYVAHRDPQLADVTGDGVPDLVVAAPFAGAGSAWGLGRLFVWQTSALSGLRTPDATLYVPGGIAYDQVGEAIELVDLTGDGVLDLLAVSPWADVGGLVDAGALYFWAGGAGIAGDVEPTATLSVPGATSYDLLGMDFHTDFTPQPWCADFTGDGVPDILVPASEADEVGQDSGALYLWSGGSALAGAVAPTATLIASRAGSRPRLGYCGGQGVFVADVDGDQRLDVIAASVWADWAGVADSGALFFWPGSGTFAGRMSQGATLFVPGANANDLLGSLAWPGSRTASKQGLWLADVTGDGLPEIVAVTPEADVAGVANAGAAYVWSGAQGLASAVAPLATMTVSGATSDDQLGR